MAIKQDREENENKSMKEGIGKREAEKCRGLWAQT